MINTLRIKITHLPNVSSDATTIMIQRFTQSSFLPRTRRTLTISSPCCRQAHLTCASQSGPWSPSSQSTSPSLKASNHSNSSKINQSQFLTQTPWQTQPGTLFWIHKPSLRCSIRSRLSNKNSWMFNCLSETKTYTTRTCKQTSAKICLPTTSQSLRLTSNRESGRKSSSNLVGSPIF